MNKTYKSYDYEKEMLTILSDHASLYTEILRKLCKSSPKWLELEKLHYLPNFLPQPANIFTYLAYPDIL